MAQMHEQKGSRDQETSTCMSLVKCSPTKTMLASGQHNGFLSWWPLWLFTAGSATFLCPIPAAFNTCSIRSLRMNHVDLLDLEPSSFTPFFAEWGGLCLSLLLSEAAMTDTFQPTMELSIYLPIDARIVSRRLRILPFEWHRQRKWRSVQNPRSMDAGAFGWG